MQKAKLRQFLQQKMRGDAMPVSVDEDTRHKNLTAGKITEITEKQWCWYMGECAGDPLLDGDLDGKHWFAVADSMFMVDGAWLCWTKNGRYFGRKLRGGESQSLWDFAKQKADQ